LTDETQPKNAHGQPEEEALPSHDHLDNNKEQAPIVRGERPCAVIPVKQLIEQLPPFITYSNLKIKPGLSIYKRELYDAKYQTIVNLAEEEEEEEGAENASKEEEGRAQQETLESLQSTSDLIPGVYEGGFKTWECSIDLATHLDPVLNNLKTLFIRPDVSTHCDLDLGRNADEDKPFRILEIGCGTAVPTASLCFQLFAYLLSLDPSAHNHPSSVSDNDLQPPILEIILQDFNSDVLKLLTFPNILLAFYQASRAAEKWRRGSGPQKGTESVAFEQGEEGTDEEETCEDDVEITDELKTDFEMFLRRHGIRLTFVYGPWSTFELPPIGPRRPSGPSREAECGSKGRGKGCEVIMSSETLYSTASLPALIDVILASKISPPEGEQSTILVASKSVYFGVGGGTHSFIHLLENNHRAVVSLSHLHQSPISPLPSNGVSRVLMDIKFKP